VDNSARDLHGGLIDAQLLAEVYLAMTSGQVALDLAFESAPEQHGAAQVVMPAVLSRRPKVLRADAEELAAHEQRLDALDKSAGGASIWRKEDAPVGDIAAAN
jgi:DNA polymerase-3 subunit epsilon